MQTPNHIVCPCWQSFPWQPLRRESEPAHSGTKGQSIRFTNRAGCNLENIHQRLHLNGDITNHPLCRERRSQNNEYKSNRSHITLLKLCFSSSLISIETSNHLSMQVHTFNTFRAQNSWGNSDPVLSLTRPSLSFKAIWSHCIVI